MRRIQKHEREVMDFIRHEFNAYDLSMESGGRHPKLRFWYKDKEYVYPMGNLNDTRAFKNLQAELRRTLGTTKASNLSAENFVEKLNSSTSMTTNRNINQLIIDIDMMDEVMEQPDTTKPSKTWAVQVASYAAAGVGNQIWFVFPKEITKSFPEPGYNIERLDEENWRISPGGKRKFGHYQNQRVKMTYTDRDLPTFKSSPAEAIESDGELLVFLAKQDRVHESTTPTIKETKMPAEPVAITVPTPAPTPVFQNTPHLAHPEPKPTMEERMRDIVRQVREIEGLCPYRLVRENGRIFWQAPTIE